jgi:hypothetical protein
LNVVLRRFNQQVSSITLYRFGSKAIMILAGAFRTLLVLAALIIHVLPVSSVAQSIRPLIKVDISVTHAADLPTDGGATVTVQGKLLDFLNFRPSVSIGGHACSRTYWMVNNPRSVTVSASIGCESPPGYGSADLRLEFYDHQLDSLVAWGQSAKSVRYWHLLVGVFLVSFFCVQC